MSETSDEVRARGGCLCGGVRYEVRGPLRDIVACHCSECRRSTGGLWHATAARREDVTVHETGALRWYRSSDSARRGFCRDCGASLFFDPDDRPFLGITAGTLEAPTGLRHRVHIFTDEAGDYYAIDDDLPKHPRGGHGLEIPEA
jgi:hypothetical protein